MLFAITEGLSCEQFRLGLSSISLATEMATCQNNNVLSMANSFTGQSFNKELLCPSCIINLAGVARSSLYSFFYSFIFFVITVQCSNFTTVH